MKLEMRKIKLNELFSQGPVSQSLSKVDLKKLRDNLIILIKVLIGLAKYHHMN